MKKLIYSVFIILCFLAGSLYASTDYVVVSAQTDLYNGDTVVGQYVKGTKFSSDIVKNGWVYATHSSGNGWVRLNDLKVDASSGLVGDYKKIQGRWVVYECLIGGVPVKERNGVVFVFEGKTFRNGPGPANEHIVLNENSLPKKIDFVNRQNSAVKGIYKFEEDRLILCTASPGSKRPRKFKSRAFLAKVILTKLVREGR